MTSQTVEPDLVARLRGRPQGRSARPRPTRVGPRRRDLALPWLVALGITVPFAAVFDGIDRAVAASAGAAFVMGGVFAITVATQQERRYRALLDASAETHAAEAHSRVVALRRQFEWTVDDLTLTRKRLKVAELRRVYAETESAELRAAVGERDREIGKVRQEVFELAALDVAELRRARDEADRRRAAADAQVLKAVADARRMERQLREARGRTSELSSIFAAIAGATSSAKEAADVPDEERASWSSLDAVNAISVEGLGGYAVLTSLRVLDSGGAVIARVPVRGHAGGAARVRLPNDARRALITGGGSVEALVDGHWIAVQPRREEAPRRDRAPGRPRHLRVVGD